MCGLSSKPACKTIQYAVASECTTKSCTIDVDGGDPMNTSPTVYYINTTIRASYDFAIKKTKNSAKPLIKMKARKPQQRFFLSAESKRRQVLHFTDIKFIGIAVVKLNNMKTETYITNCYVERSPMSVIFSRAKLFSVKIRILGSFFYKCSGLTQLEHLHSGQFIVNNSTFSTDQYSSIYTGFHITKAMSSLSMKFTNSIFETIKKPLEIQIQNTGNDNGNILIAQSLFQWNREPVNITGSTQVVIQDTRFSENNHGSLQIAESDNVIINKCRFLHNFRRSALSLMSNRLVFINASTFEGNTDEFQGGAIFGYNNKIFVQYSIFKGNSAPLSGGTIFHTASTRSCCELDLKNVTIASVPDTSSRSGTLISSSQMVKLTNVVAKMAGDERPARGAYMDGMVSSHSIVVVKQSSFEFTCPVNNNPEVIQTKYTSRSSIVVTPSGAESMGCRKCPKQTYSLLSITMRTSKFIRDKKHCLKCPKGGNCTDGIVSRDNFWGYRNQDLIQFLPCPVAYCCSKYTVPCDNYQTCGHFRQGVLCGNCKPSYTLSYFTDSCTKNKSCNRTLFWCLYGVYACAVVIMFMYFERFFLRLKQLWNALKNNNDNKERQIVPSRQCGDTPELTRRLLDDYDGNESTPSTEEVPRNGSILDEHLQYEQASVDTLSGQLENSSRIINQSIPNESIINQSNNPQSNDSESDNSQSDDMLSDNNQSVPLSTTTTTTDSNTKDLINGFAKVIFFFYQTEHLLRVNSTVEKDYGLLTRLKYITTSVFNLHLESNQVTSLCPMLELNKLLKELIKVSTVFLCLFIVMCLYLLASWLKRCRIRLIQCLTGESLKEFQLHLKQCIVQLLLFGYANMTDCSLIMLNCVDVIGENRLYHYGDLVCYTWWQIVIFVFLLTWLLPFPFAVKFGLSMLQKRQISVREFYFLLFCPACFPLFYIHSKVKRTYTLTFTIDQQTELKSLFQIFSGPYRITRTDVGNGNSEPVPISWDSFILMRRFFLSVVCGFVINPVGRLFATYPTLIIIFLLQIYYAPFKLSMLNRAEIASLSLLLWLNTTNLFWAFSYMNDISDMPGFDLLATIFGIVEDVVLALPVIMIALGIVGFGLKKCVSFCSCCTKQLMSENNMSVVE